MGKLLLSIGAVALAASSAAFVWAGGDKCTGAAAASAGSCGDKGASLVSTGGCTEKASTVAATGCTGAAATSLVSTTGGEQCTEKTAAKTEGCTAAKGTLTLVSTGGDQCTEKTAAKGEGCDAAKGTLTLVTTGGDQCTEKTAAVAADSKGACCATGDKAASLVMADTAAKPLEAIKGLAGKWEGKTEHGASAVEYKVSSNGSVVVETMFPGTQHEMTNVYAMDGDRLLMTHYCAGGNQPRMAMTKQEGNVYTFQMVDATNVADKSKGMLMNGLVLTIDSDKIVQEWSAMMDGKPADHAKFELSRVKTSSAAAR